MGRTSHPWYTITAKSFITVVGLLGLTLMSIATYDMIQTLDNAKRRSKVQGDINLAAQVDLQNGFNSKDGTTHQFSSNHAEQDQEQQQQQFQSSASNTIDINYGYTTTELYPTTTQQYISQAETTEIGEDWSTGVHPATNSKHHTRGSQVFFPDENPNSHIGTQTRSPGHDRHIRYQNSQRHRREVSTTSPSGLKHKSVESDTNSTVVVGEVDVNKMYRGILIGCQVFAIIVGFIQLVTACGIVCSCSPYVPKRVKQWLVINTFLFLVGFLCFIIPLTIRPEDGTWLDTKEVKDAFVVKYEELNEIKKKEVLLKNLFLYTIGINEAFLLVTIVLVGSLLPCGTQPYDSVY